MDTTAKSSGAPPAPTDLSEGAGIEHEVLDMGFEPVLSRLKATTIAEETRSAVLRCRYPGLSQEHFGAQQRRAIAEVEAGAEALPLDPSVSVSDRLVLEEGSALSEERRSARQRIETKKSTFEQERRNRAAFMPPLNALQRLGVAVGLICVMLITAAAVGRVMWPSADQYLLRSYLTHTYRADVAELSSEQGLLLACLCVGALLFGPVVLTLSTWGRISWPIKLFLVTADVAFSLAFAATRMGRQITFLSISVSLFELAPLIVFSAVLFGISTWLRRDGERAERHQLAVALESCAAREYLDEVKALQEIERRYMTHRQALTRREMIVRRLPAATALAASTVEAAHVSAVAELISDQVDRLAEEGQAISAPLDELLDTLPGLNLAGNPRRNS